MPVVTLPYQKLEELSTVQTVVDALESGKVIYLPYLSFELSEAENRLLTPTVLPKNSKNISYDARVKKLRGFDEPQRAQEAELIKAMMARYVDFTQQVVQGLLPHYMKSLIVARTSYRPVEVAGRVAPSYRKDDTRLHVDAFPASPTHGQRVLRVFSNINPVDKPRVWQVGESFEKVVAYFKNRIKLTPIFYRRVLAALKITRSFRTDYDALMLQIHDTMKGDMDYQRKADQQRLELAAGGTWLVFTDQVSHAALAGQYCLEQTIMLPVSGMQDPDKSPLRVLEKQFGKVLV